MSTAEQPHPTHSLIVGYICWGFGFFGAHRFYYGRQVTGTLWFFTLGLLGIGWIIDLFLMPMLNAGASRKYVSGEYDYTIGWILQTYLGVFGVHRFYLGKWITGIIWFLTGGLFLVGWFYDMWTLNRQISDANQAHSPALSDLAYAS